MSITSAELEGLAASAAQGDHQALEQLLREARPLVLRLCARFLPCPQDAEDACQETLLAVAQGVPGWDGRARFGTWLYRVAANRSRSTYQVLRRRASERPVDTVPENADPRTTSVIAGTRLDLMEALAALAPDVAEAVALRDVLDLEYREIALLLDIPEGTVKSRIHDGRQRVRSHLAS